MAGGVYFFLNYEIQTQYVDGKPAYWKIVPKGAAARPSRSIDPSAEPPRPTIRIATFQLGRLDDAKLANRRVSDVLVRLLPRFDLVACRACGGRTKGC